MAIWECPDYFELDGKKFLSVSPQGLKREEFRFQNIYQSGYFPVKEDGSVDEKTFVSGIWDLTFMLHRLLQITAEGDF